MSTSKLLRDYRSDAGNTGESKNSGWFAPILKTSVHAELCSGDFQNGLVLLSIVSVFRLWGSSGVYTFSEQSSRFRTAREFRNLLDLPSPWDSLLSCVYNVQYFFEFVNSFMSLQKCNLHKQPFTSLFDIPGLKAKKGEIIGLSENRHAPGAARAGSGINKEAFHERDSQ